MPLPNERLHVVVPMGTKIRAEKAARTRKFDTMSSYIRRIVLDAIETDLKEAKREKAR